MVQPGPNTSTSLMTHISILSLDFGNSTFEGRSVFGIVAIAHCSLLEADFVHRGNKGLDDLSEYI